jgi:hypothetical protein
MPEVQVYEGDGIDRAKQASSGWNPNSNSKQLSVLIGAEALAMDVLITKVKEDIEVELTTSFDFSNAPVVRILKDSMMNSNNPRMPDAQYKFDMVINITKFVGCFVIAEQVGSTTDGRNFLKFTVRADMITNA